MPTVASALPRERTHRSAPLDNGISASLTVVAACLVLRILFLRAIPINSDEPQHLHVVWAWSRGLVPYRDAFDNHAPLFHLLYAPLLRMIGETPDVLLWMRLAIVPLAIASIACAARIGRELWGWRAALWGSLLACVLPTYLSEAGQFRADALWAAAWLAAVLAAISGRWSWRRAFWFGLLAGAAFATSLKTSLLACGMLIAWAMVVSGMPPRLRPPAKTWAGSAAAMLAGLVVLPALVVVLVAVKGGLAAMVYGVFLHNMLPGLGRAGGRGWRLLAISFVLLLLALASRRAMRATVDQWRCARRSLVVLSAIAYALLLLGFWPLVTPQDQLPVVPLLTVALSGWWLEGGRRRPAWVPPALLGAGLLLAAVRYPPWNDRLATYRTTLSDVLALTTDREPVMDAKGGSVYRVRPFYYALEGITRERIRRGLIVDDIPGRLVSTDTRLVWPKSLLPADMPFIASNYVAIGDGLMVAGHEFDRQPEGTERSVRILLPGCYVLGGDRGKSHASIDGKPYFGPRWLDAGLHMLAFAKGGDYALVWCRAAGMFFHRPSARTWTSL